MCGVLPGCYGGDGLYSTDGVLLKSHTLALPLGSLGERAEYSFEIEGFVFNSETIQMSMVVRSPHQKEYWEMTNVVALEIYDVATESIVYEKRSILPEYYVRALKRVAIVDL